MTYGAVVKYCRYSRYATKGGWLSKGMLGAPGVVVSVVVKVARCSR